MKSLKESYDLFIREYERIHQYFNFTGLSFALVGTMEDKAKEYAKDKTIKIDKQKFSYSKADRKKGRFVVTCEWLSLEEYSKKESIPVGEIEEQAEKGLLGPVHIEDNQKYIIWPKDRQQDTDLPEFGLKEFSRADTITGVTTVKMWDSRQVLAMLGRYSDLGAVVDQSQKQLCPSCLLSYWTAFEAYVKDFVETLYYLHPEQVLNKHGKDGMTLKAIFDSSRKFTDMDSLKQKVLDEVLTKYDRENISRLIDFVGDCYLGNGVDPFSTYYIGENKRQEVSRGHLDQIRTIRNALIHDNGYISEKDWKKIDLVSRGEDSTLLISDDELGRIYFILKAIAHNLYELTCKQYPDVE